MLVRFRPFHAQPPFTYQRHDQLLSSTFLELAPSLLIKHFAREFYLHCLSWVDRAATKFWSCDLVLPHYCSSTLFNHERTRAPHTIGGSRRDHSTDGEWIASTEPRKISDCWRLKTRLFIPGDDLRQPQLNSSPSNTGTHSPHPLHLKNQHCLIIAPRFTTFISRTCCTAPPKLQDNFKRRCRILSSTFRTSKQSVRAI